MSRHIPLAARDQYEKYYDPSIPQPNKKRNLKMLCEQEIARLDAALRDGIPARVLTKRFDLTPTSIAERRKQLGV